MTESSITSVSRSTRILDALLSSLPDGIIRQVYIGLNWTIVLAEIEGALRCGLAATVTSPHDHEAGPNVPDAGRLTAYTARELAALARSEKPTLASIGVATINALLPPCPHLWSDRNAGEVLAEYGRGKHVALVGHFPFVEDLKGQVKHLSVLEQDPQPGDLPAEKAPQILPEADVVAITAMTLVNHTLDDLLALCSPSAKLMLLGPSTPLTPLLFDCGFDLLSGSYVINIEAVVNTVLQGGTYKQVHRAGTRLVTMIKAN